MDPKIAEIQEQYLRNDLPAFAPGDTVRVRVRVVEGDKERIQAFEGVCIGRRGAGVSETFTVRRVTGGVGVERTFPVHSPSVAGIEVVRRGHVRRAKLYYLRARRGKRARVRERRWWLDVAAEMEDVAGVEKEATVPQESAGGPVGDGADEDAGEDESVSSEEEGTGEPRARHAPAEATTE